jgi:NTP pyrophosphatase (non-canonical NTP hydrolase)
MSLAFLDYQSRAKETAIYPSHARVTYPALGLAGEAGEVANKVKKVIRDNNGVVPETTRQAISQELGDVLWYMASLATDLGLDLSEIAADNLAKLWSRKERGTLQGSGDQR